MKNDRSFYDINSDCVENIRAFEDGDKVCLQTVYNFAGSGEQVAFISSGLMKTA